MLKQLFLVFLGGGLGSAARYGTGILLAFYRGHWPIGTFGVNMLGCFLVGLIFALGTKYGSLSENGLLLLVVGFCGGFTTFSAFAYENLSYLKNGEPLYFMLYSLGSLILGLLAVALGMLSARLL